MKDPATEFQHSHAPALLLAILGGCVGYILAHLGVLPILCYLPTERRWTFEPGDALAMHYYGTLIASVLCALGAAALGGIKTIAEALARPPYARVLARLAVLMILFTMGYIALVEFTTWS